MAAVAAAGTSLAIPGLGVVIAGPLAAALAGAGAGAATGGLLGAQVLAELVKFSFGETLPDGFFVKSDLYLIALRRARYERFERSSSTEK